MQYVQILLGLLCCTLAYRSMLIPAQIAPGGFTGAAQLMQHLVGVPVGITTLAMNVPLFIVSARSLGLRFGLRSLIAMAALSLMIDYLPIPPLLDMEADESLLLSAVFGGLMGGAGFGLIIRGNATTGGSDMLGKLVTRRFSFISVGAVMFAVDAVVILASAFVFGAASALMALISDYLMSYMIDMMVDGLNSARAYFVISDKADEIAEYVMRHLDRGCTNLHGEGMYSRQSKNVLLCVLNRTEGIQLRTAVARVDSRAFVFSAKVHEVLGEGFRPHTPPKRRRE